MLKRSRVPGDAQDFGLICSFLTKEIISKGMEDTSQIITEWASSGRSEIPATGGIQPWAESHQRLLRIALAAA